MPEDTVVSPNLQSVMDKARTIKPPPKPVVKPVDSVDDLLAEPVVEPEVVDAVGVGEEATPELPPVSTPDVPNSEPVAESTLSPGDDEPVASPPPQPPVELAVEVNIGDSEILSGTDTLTLYTAINSLFDHFKKDGHSIFKVAALQSGYTAELSALAFEDISRLQSSAVDAYAARMKLLRTL